MLNNQGVLVLRSADPGDAPIVLSFLNKLAAYQGLTGEVHVTEGVLRKQLSPENVPQIWTILAEIDRVSVGMAVYYLTYSTFRGKWAIHLEDLYIEEGRRGEGIARGFFTTLARIAHEHGYDRIEFSVQTTNIHARKFYEVLLGAQYVEDWLPMRIEGEQLELLYSQPGLFGICRPS